MDEHIRQVQLRAYHEGYIAGYQRGMEDGRAGMQTPPALLDCPLQFLNLSTRPFNSLDRAGYRTVGDIVSLNRQEIWKIRSLGAKGLHEIAQALWDAGIRDSRWNEWLYPDGPSGGEASR